MILEAEYKGAMIRCRLEAQQRDEEPIKSFRTKERQHAARNRIEALQDGDDVVTRQEDFVSVFTGMYKSLFEERYDVHSQMCSVNCADLLPKVSDDIKEETNESISESEIEWAIKALKPRKAPGIDSLGSAFYKKFASELVPVLWYVYEDILKRDLMPPSMRRGLTVIIPKRHSNRLPTPGDFCHISLLTTDYKLLAKLWRSDWT